MLNIKLDPGCLLKVDPGSPFNPQAIQGAVMILDALKLLNVIVNSSEFKKRVLQESSGWTFTDGLFPQKIYDRLVPDKEVVIDFVQENRGWLKRKLSSTVGWTEGNQVHTYQDVINTAGVEWLAGHFAHEIVGHMVGGFEHPFLDDPARPRSVPYQVGALVEELAYKVGAPNG